MVKGRKRFLSNLRVLRTCCICALKRSLSMSYSASCPRFVDTDRPLVPPGMMEKPPYSNVAPVWAERTRLA